MDLFLSSRLACCCLSGCRSCLLGSRCRLSLDNLHTLLKSQFGRLLNRLWQTIVCAVVSDIRSESAVQNLEFRFFVETFDMLLSLGLALSLDKVDGCMQSQCHRVEIFRNRYIHAVVINVWSESACAYLYRLALKLAKDSRQFEQVESLFESDCVHSLSRLHLGKARLLLVLSRTNLNHRAKAADFNEYRLAAGWVDAKFMLANLVLALKMRSLLYHRFKIAVESAHKVGPFNASLCHLIEILLYICRKVVIKDRCKMLRKEVVYNRSYICRNELCLLVSSIFLFCFGCDALLVESAGLLRL